MKGIVTMLAVLAAGVLLGDEVLDRVAGKGSLSGINLDRKVSPKEGKKPAVVAPAGALLAADTHAQDAPVLPAIKITAQRPYATITRAQLEAASKGRAIEPDCTDSEDWTAKPMEAYMKSEYLRVYDDSLNGILSANIGAPVRRSDAPGIEAADTFGNQEAQAVGMRTVERGVGPYGNFVDCELEVHGRKLTQNDQGYALGPAVQLLGKQRCRVRLAFIQQSSGVFAIRPDFKCGFVKGDIYLPATQPSGG